MRDLFDDVLKQCRMLDGVAVATAELVPGPPPAQKKGIYINCAVDNQWLNVCPADTLSFARSMTAAVLRILAKELTSIEGVAAIVVQIVTKDEQQAPVRLLMTQVDTEARESLAFILEDREINHFSEMTRFPPIEPLLY